MGATIGDCGGQQAFCRVVEKGDVEYVKREVHQVGRLDFRERKTGYTPLMLASVVGTGDYYDIAHLLLSEGAPVEQADPQRGQTSLFLASLGGHLDLVRLLIKHDANVNHVTKEGFTPFYAACWRNRLEVAKLLLSHGADVGHRAPDGTDSLAIAKEWNSDAVVAFLEQISN
ncbi:hypothetical protein AAMO2058_000314500 [Amorphochlora amoebiformis]